LVPILRQHNHCFEAIICSEDSGFVLERENATEWESQEPTECRSFTCVNETGAATLSVCDSPKVCHMKYEDEDLLPLYIISTYNIYGTNHPYYPNNIGGYGTVRQLKSVSLNPSRTIEFYGFDITSPAI